jgi:hypothetical protein
VEREIYKFPFLTAAIRLVAVQFFAGWSPGHSITVGYMYSGVHPVCNRQNFAKCAQILGKILSKIYFKKSSLDPIKMCAYPMVAAVEIPGNKPLSGGEIPKEIRGLKWKLSEGNKGGLEWKLIFKATLTLPPFFSPHPRLSSLQHLCCVPALSLDS